jgi:hypothetical protein
MATEVLRAAAVFNRAHGAASAYRFAVVTKSHRSALSSTLRESARFVSEMESISGQSRMAVPASMFSSAMSTTPGIAD